MLSRDEQAERIIAAWVEHGVDADTTATELAEIALTALECGETHPDRASVRCTQLPHGNGHLYHRNTELGLEWWTNGNTTQTVHDVLGPIHLGQPPAAAEPQETAAPCPECQWIRQDSRDHDQLIGGWLRCAHCGHEWNGSESRPSTWCRAKHPHFDMYCDTMHHPLNTRRHGSSIYSVQWTDPQDPAESDQRGRYHTLPPCEDDPEPAEADHGPWGADDPIPDHVDRIDTAHKFEWSRVRNRDGENTGWFELTACPVLPEADLLVQFGPVTESVDPPELADSLSATIDADRAVYRDLVPVLTPVRTFLDQIGKRYREGNPRTTADQCRAAETFRDQLTTVVDTLHEMTGAGTDDKV